jgi:hypothetical protein
LLRLLSIISSGFTTATCGLISTAGDGPDDTDQENNHDDPQTTHEDGVSSFLLPLLISLWRSSSMPLWWHINIGFGRGHLCCLVRWSSAG